MSLNVSRFLSPQTSLKSLKSIDKRSRMNIIFFLHRGILSCRSRHSPLIMGCLSNTSLFKCQPDQVATLNKILGSTLETDVPWILNSAVEVGGSSSTSKSTTSSRARDYEVLLLWRSARVSRKPGTKASAPQWGKTVTTANVQACPFSSRSRQPLQNLVWWEWRRGIPEIYHLL